MPCGISRHREGACGCPREPQGGRRCWRGSLCWMRRRTTSCRPRSFQISYLCAIRTRVRTSAIRMRSEVAYQMRVYSGVDLRDPVSEVLCLFLHIARILRVLDGTENPQHASSCPSVSCSVPRSLATHSEVKLACLPVDQCPLSVLSPITMCFHIPPASSSTRYWRYRRHWSYACWTSDWFCVSTP